MTLAQNLKKRKVNPVVGTITDSQQQGRSMIITTTPSVDGYLIKEYRGIVFGEVVAGVNFLRDIGAAFRNVFGGRSQGYEDELTRARSESVEEMTQRAMAMDADAVVGVKMDYEILGAQNDMLMVTCSGTAVKLKKI